MLGMRRAEIVRKFDGIVEFAGIEHMLDTPVKRYSSGMYVRLGFAVAAHLEPDILVVDEVLAVGDAPFQGKCLELVRHLSQEGTTVLLVSHNLGTVVSFCRSRAPAGRRKGRCTGLGRGCGAGVRTLARDRRRGGARRAQRPLRRGPRPPHSVRIDAPATSLRRDCDRGVADVHVRREQAGSRPRLRVRHL